MKRWLTHATIAGYISLLVYGVMCHAVGYNLGRHPAMYFIVWDMYCGWSAFETRLHVVGEGQSGQVYALNPLPWGEFKPFGVLGRYNYDGSAAFSDRYVQYVLRHTDHEPMLRMYVVEEVWSKKFNLPEALWNQQYDEPRQPRSYFHLRCVLDADGRLVSRMPDWSTHLAQRCVMNNPRLRQDVVRGSPFYAVTPSRHAAGAVTPAAFVVPPAADE